MSHQNGARFGLAIATLALAGAMAGCTALRIYATSGNTIALSTLRQGQSESFTVVKHTAFDYTGAIDVQEIVRTKYGSGVTLQNVSVKVKMTVGDFFLNMVTLGIANSKHYEVTGDAVRAP